MINLANHLSGFQDHKVHLWFTATAQGFVTTWVFKKKKEKKYNTQRHKLKFPVSMNYLVALIFTLTALCTAQIYHVPLHLQPSVWPPHLLWKRSKLERVENRRGWALYSEFLLYCYLSDFFSWHFISPAFTVCNHMQILKEGEREVGWVGWIETEEGLGGVRDGCKCGIM